MPSAWRGWSRSGPTCATDYSINEGGGDRQLLVDGRIVVPICVGEKACLVAMVTALGEAGHASTPTPVRTPCRCWRP